MNPGCIREVERVVELLNLILIVTYNKIQACELHTRSRTLQIPLDLETEVSILKQRQSQSIHPGII